MQAQPAAFLRTTLPLDLAQLEAMDTGRYHSVWLPDHMVSFWPDAIWTPEFTDLATLSPSPHRHLDGLAVAAAAAARTSRVRIATCVVDTVRRHPAMLAQTALTIDHMSKGRFILGLGSGEAENIAPYGFDFHRPVGRLEECLKVIRLLWERDGPVDFEGEFFRLDQARLDAEPYEGRFPQIWMGAWGPRMIELAGRYADGWWPAAGFSPEDYAERLGVLRGAAERAGRDPVAITPALTMAALIAEDDMELAEIVRAPLVKAFVFQVPGIELARRGFAHPLGDDWRGIQDLDPGKFSRQVILDLLAKVTPEALLAVVPHGTPAQVGRRYAEYAQAGMRVPKILDYSGMAGLAFAARSPAKVLAAEDEFIRLTQAPAALPPA
jgi:phthiodiolone/phenolphthiodiolone dimycocerosates ketoreductase